MDNKSTTKRMIGAVVLVLIAALLLAWLLKGKNRTVEQKDLIAEQAQDASPILGFPGVNKDGQALVDGQQLDPAAQQAALQGGATQEYALGQVAGTGAATDAAAQQQAQNVLNGQAADGSTPIGTADGSAAAAAGAGAAGIGAAVTGAVSGAVEAGKEAVQGLASQLKPDTTGFQVRDSNGEVRQVVADGKVEPGIGSMGATDVAANGKQAAGAGADAANQAAAGAGAEATKQAQAAAGAATQPAAGAATQQAAAAGTAAQAGEKAKPVPAVVAANKDRPAIAGGELKLANNPRLVNERPVPPPAAQVAAASRQAAADRERQAAARVEAERAAARAAAAKKDEDKAKTASAAGAGSAAGEAAGSAGYVIQVLATSDKGKADGIKQTISVDGYPAFVTSAKVDGKTVYRVRVGTYPGKGDAAAVQARMKARYAQNQYVQNSFVTKN